MAEQPDSTAEWDSHRAVVLIAGKPESAEDTFALLSQHPIPGLRLDSLRWGLTCRIHLHQGAASAQLTFLARRGRLEVQIPAAHRFICDHVATAGRWFSLDADAAQEAAKAVAMSDQNLVVSAASALELAVVMRSAGINVAVASVEKEQSATHSEARDWRHNFSIGTRLFPYQESGIEWLRQRHRAGMGALLADEMGLGKTLQAIAWVVADIEEGGRVLIVTPASLTENWRRELGKFANIQPFLYVGRGLATAPKVLLQQPVVLTTYDSVRQHQLVLDQIPWSTVIADEAQYIKNADSGRSKSMKALPRERALAVTGTPLENRLSEVVSVLEFVAPRVFGPMTRQNEQQLEVNWETNVHPFLGSLMLRREVKDVRQDLPPKIFIPSVLVPSPKYLHEQQRLIEEAQKAGSRERLALITRLRQLSGIGPVDVSAKGEFLDTIVNNLKSTSGKALIFASFSNSIEALSAYAASRQIACWTITGSTPPSLRQDVVDLFSSHPGGALLVLNPKAGGVGLNITAANVVIHWEPDWNPAVTDQATARAHRTGQEQTVFVYNLFYAGSIEEYIVTKQDAKRRLAADAVQPSEAPLSAGEVDKIFKWLEKGLGE
jgi:SNF2 family DNA or RNA helicase